MDLVLQFSQSCWVIFFIVDRDFWVASRVSFEGNIFEPNVLFLDVKSFFLSGKLIC